MKKIYALLIVCAMSTMQADPLSNAIQASDVEAVRALVFGTRLTNTQMIKYLDTADQMVQLRRENRVWGRTDFGDRYMWIGWGSALGCIACSFGWTGSRDPLVRNVAGVSALACWTVLLANEIVRGYRIKALHANALTIKEILYDSLDVVGLESTEVDAK